MPTERLSIRRIRQVLQQHFWRRRECAGAREARGTRSTVQDYVARANGAKLGLPLPQEPTDLALEQRPFPSLIVRPGVRLYPASDWASPAREMKRTGVSLMILWEEYQTANAQGYSGNKAPIVDPLTGEVWIAEIFFGVLTLQL